jgi:hypothetical protein
MKSHSSAAALIAASTSPHNAVHTSRSAARAAVSLANPARSRWSVRAGDPLPWLRDRESVDLVSVSERGHLGKRISPARRNSIHPRQGVRSQIKLKQKLEELTNGIRARQRFEILVVAKLRGGSTCCRQRRQRGNYRRPPRRKSLQDTRLSRKAKNGLSLPHSGAIQRSEQTATSSPAGRQLPLAGGTPSADSTSMGIWATR